MKPLLSVQAGTTKNPLTGKLEEWILVRPRRCRPADIY